MLSIVRIHKYVFEANQNSFYQNENANLTMLRLVSYLLRPPTASSRGGSRAHVAPHSLLTAFKHSHPMFRGFQQQDSQEFLKYFLDQMHDELSEPISAPDDAGLVTNSILLWWLFTIHGQFKKVFFSTNTQLRCQLFLTMTWTSLCLAHTPDGVLVWSKALFEIEGLWRAPCMLKKPFRIINFIKKRKD